MNHTATVKKKKRTVHRANTEGDSVKPVFFNTLKGALTGIISSFILLLIASAFAMSTQDPVALAGPISYVVLLLGAFIGGIASAKINGGDVMLCGIMCGALYLGFVLLVSLFIQNEGTSFILSLGLRSVSVLSAIVGACITDKKVKKPKKRKRH